MPFTNTATDLQRGVKHCARCEQEKPLTEFGKVRARGGGGWAAYCRDCAAQYSRERRSALDPETRARYAATTRKWQRENPDKVLANERRRRLRRYGITLEGFEAFLSEQGGCAICGALPDDPYTLCVDHDHDTGRVRGLLCQPCNRGIGFLKDDPVVIDRAADYLRRTKGR